MAVSIRSTLHTVPAGPVTGPILVDQSRDDLRPGYQVVLESVNVHTTYSWALSFTPNSPDGTGSTAALLAPEGSTSQTAKFNVDLEGAYLVRLVADAGLPTEDTMFLRFRFLTRFGNLKLVAAGERRDANGVVPEDATAEGWSNDQNQNLQYMIAQLRRQATTGRVLYVDANRGRDPGENQNDPTNLYSLPGADPSALVDNLTFTSEGHGDFSTVNEAITYANAAVARGEPAPSATAPYFVLIKPGLYTEDLSLQPWIHLMGTTTGTQVALSAAASDVVIRTANAGAATHTYAAAADASVCALFNLTLENTAVVATPVLSHTRGTLHLHRCHIWQKGNGAAQGAAYNGTSVNALSLFADSSEFISDANLDNNRVAFYMDTDGGGIALRNCYVGGRSALFCNPTGYDNVLLNLTDCEVLGGAGYGIRGVAENITLNRTQVGATTAALSLVFDDMGGGAGMLAGDMMAQLRFCYIQQLTFDTAAAGGGATTTLRMSGTAAITEPHVVLPSGDPTVYESQLPAKTIEYVPDYENPNNPGVDVVPALAQFTGLITAQDALDRLVRLTNPSGVTPPGFGLVDAYNGIASIDPFVVGAGLGRTILADDGAVRIIGAPAPAGGALDPTLNGGLQTEGPIDLGPLKADGLGSEIFMEPNPFGIGPRVTFGRDVWPQHWSTYPAALPATVLRGGLNTTGSAPTSSGGYNFWILTRSAQNVGSSEFGRIILSAGNNLAGSFGNDDGGGVFLEAGHVFDTGLASADGGTVWLVPGATANMGTEGRIRIPEPASATPGNLTGALACANPAAQTGVLYIGTPDSNYQITITAGDNPVTVINTACAGEVIASYGGGGELVLTTSKVGVNASLVYVGDSVAGLLNTDLGELRVGSGATWTAGTYPNFVEIACTATGVLTVYGSVVATVLGVGYYNMTAVEISPYVVGAGIGTVGVDTGGPPRVVDLPPAPVLGQTVTVKDETGGAPVTVNGNGFLIDGVPFVATIAPLESFTMYFGLGGGAVPPGWFLVT